MEFKEWLTQKSHLKYGRVGAWGMRALPIWILAKQRLSLCLHKYFLIATSVTFFFFQLSFIILIWQMILFFSSIKMLIHIVIYVLTVCQAIF